jgi:hypothetical protein
MAIRGMRALIRLADEVDIWFQNTFKLKPKQRSIEITQNLTPRKNLDKTIGKSLGIK